MSEHARIAVVGVAGMGFYHAISVPRIDGLELVALCDVDVDAAEKLASSVGSPEVFGSIRDLAASGVADAVVVATPNVLHAEHAIAALEAGLHVYCEKPVAVTVSDARRIGEAADASGRRFAVGFQHRFQADHLAARALVAGGALGPLYRANLVATDWFRPQSYFEQRTWRKRWDGAGGGVLMNQSIHQVDTFLWLAGMPTRVTARAWTTGHVCDVEDDATAILEWPNGARGTLSASTVDAVGTNRIELYGDRGAVVVEDGAARAAYTPDGVRNIIETREDRFAPVDHSWEDVACDGPTTFDACVVASLSDFAGAIRDGRDPLVTCAEATRATELANAVYLSAVTGHPVDLPLDAGAYDELFARLCSGDACLPPSGGRA